MTVINLFRELKLLNSFISKLIINSNEKSHINQKIPKLRSTCFAMRSLMFLAGMELSKTAYFTYFNSTVIWHNFMGKINSNKVFLSQKKIMRLMPHAQTNEPQKRVRFIPAAMRT
jgi:hypothetical protein